MSSDAFAQSGSPSSAKVFKSCPSIQGAGCIEQPGADTPVAKQFQDSYAVYLKMKQAAGGGTQYARGDYAKMPDWSGIWTRLGGVKFDPDQVGRTAEGNLRAELTPAYEAAYRKKLKDAANNVEWDQLSDCLPAGFPRWLTEPFLREFIVAPGMTWWINEMQSEVRRIYTDGRGHLPDGETKALWTGDSIGFWDGDTLVVHTINVTHGQYNRLQPDYSQSTSTVERIRMIDPNTIENQITVWDPKGLKKPWHVVNKFGRITTAHSRIDMWSCEQNNNVIRTADGSTQFILPGETVTMQRAYRDPDSFYLTEEQKKLFADELGN